MRKSLAAVSLVFLCLGMIALARGSGESKKSKFLENLPTAEQESGGGTLIYGRAEPSGASGYYIYILGRLQEVEVMKPGEVVKNKQTEEIPDKGPINKKLIEALKVRTKTKLPNARYIEIALDRTGAKDVKSFTLIPVGNNIHVQIETDNGRITTMDLTDGKIISR